MTEHVDWIRDGLRRDKTKTSRGLAAALNIHASAISRILKGERQLKYGEAVKAAAYLGVALPAHGFEEPPAEFDHGGRESASALVPVFDTQTNAEHRVILNRSALIDQKQRAPHFAGSAKVFGFYIKDEHMAPRFKPGEIAWVDPARPVRAGDDIVLSSPLSSNKEDIVLCELIEATACHWKIFQHNGDGPLLFAKAQWQPLHVLPRY